MLLSDINHTNDIKKIEPDDYEVLAEEIREFLIDTVSIHGGHLSSNLGVVELTMALHIAYDLSKDKLIWDVGHQCYTHKILTGRKYEFMTLRDHGGLSGFPKRCESDADVFDMGHSSTSISVGLGLATARDLSGEDYKVVSVIGDGALTGGMAFEALNNAAKLNSNYVIVLNDNEMSISPNVGGVSTYLEGIRTTDSYQELKEDIWAKLNKIPKFGNKMADRIEKAKNSIKSLVIPGMMFEDMGITYLGPVDGHDVEKMVATFKRAMRVKGPVLVHVLTTKGKGYIPAERHPSRFHGTGSFDVDTGMPLEKKLGHDYTDVFSSMMCKMGEENDKIVAVTAAMEMGTGLRRFHQMFPDRFFDVGIAEEHAVTFAAAMATQGFVPVCAIYSSFLQRAYDQLIEDVCLQKLHVVFAIDRAGIVGAEGETHQGVFDFAYLNTIPGMTVLAPMNKWELADMLRFSIDFDGPIAIRYPKGIATNEYKEFRSPIEYGKSLIMKKGRDVAILAVGSMVDTAMRVAKNTDFTVVNMRFEKPLDTEMLDYIASTHNRVITLEEGIENGGMGEMILKYYAKKKANINVDIVALPDRFIEQGSISTLKNIYEIDEEAVLKLLGADFEGKA